MEKMDILPVGTFVQLKNDPKTYMIIGRGVMINEPEEAMADYSACMIPEGLINDNILYFDHGVIEKVIQLGWISPDEKEMVDYLNTRFREYKGKRIKAINIKDLLKEEELEW